MTVIRIWLSLGRYDEAHVRNVDGQLYGQSLFSTEAVQRSRKCQAGEEVISRRESGRSVGICTIVPA